MATSVLEVLINGNSTGLTGALSKAGLATKAFQKEVQTTGAATQTAVGGVSQSLRALSPAFIAAGAVATIAIAKGIAATQEWASETRTLQRVTGQSAESASSLLAVSDHLGISVQQLTVAFGLLSKNIVNGSTGFTKYGISVRDAQGSILPFDDVLTQVIDKFQQIPKGAEQAAFAQNVFGRSGKALLPILQKGTAGLDELKQEAAAAGLVMNQQTVDASKELTLAQRGLSEAFKGASISIGETFIPILTKVTTSLTTVVELFNKVPVPVKAAVFGFTALTGAVAGLQLVGGFFTRTWGKVLDVFTSTAPTATAAASGIGETGVAATVTAPLVGELTGVLQALAESLGVEIPAASASATQGLIGYGTTESGLIAPTTALTEANIALADSQAAVKTGAIGAGAATAGGGLLGFLRGLIPGTQAATLALGEFYAAYKFLGAPTVAPVANLDQINSALVTYSGELDEARKGGLFFNGTLTETAQSLRTDAKGWLDTAVALGANKQAFALAAKEGITYDQALQLIAQDASNAGSAVKGAGSGVDVLTLAIRKGRGLLDAMGTSFSQLGTTAQAAFDQAQQSGKDTTEAIQGFAQAEIDAAKQARQAFQSQAQSALTFTTSMLSSLEQAAQSAQQTLAGDTSSLSNDALAALRDQAHLTAGDILSTFKTAAAQTKQFGHDLLEISRVGGKAGKDLASSLLTAGDVLSAQLIADAPAKLQSQIVGAFGTSENAANSFASKLTDSIVGPLDDIKNILQQLAKQYFHVNLHLNDGGAQKKTDHLQETVDHLRGPHVLHVSADDGASYKIGVIHDRASALIAAPYQVRLGISTEEARTQLQNFDTTLNTFLSQKRQIDIGVHTHPSSPWPDEALKTHLTDPIQRAGFKKINGTWTLPLSVGVHGELGPMSDLWKRQAEDAATSIVALTNRSGSTPKEGVGIVRHVAQAGSDSAYIKSVAAGVGKELNAAQAQHFERALQLLDKRTMEGGARSDAAIQAALGKMSHLLDQNQAATRQWMTDALNYATKNAPRLPRGHTNISVNHHERRRQEVVLDRRRFAEAAAYDIDYARGF